MSLLCAYSGCCADCQHLSREVFQSGRASTRITPRAVRLSTRRPQQARQALESLDRKALAGVGLGSGADAPPLAMRAVPKKPRFRDVAKRDRFRITPAAKKVLEEAYKPKGHRKLQVTGPEVLAQILALRPPDPAAVLLDALGVNTSEVLRRLDAVTDLAGEAAQETSADAAVPPNDRPRR